MADFPIPSFLENQSVEEIHKRMLAQLPADIDTSQGGHPYNLTIPTAYVGSYFAEFIMVEALKQIFPKYAQDYADIMDDHAETRGLERKAATYATGEITITGAAGTEIPKESAFSTMSINGEPAVEYITIKTVTIGDEGSVKANVQAVEAGTVGNVPAGTIILKANKISGITGVTNEKEITGGTEEEDTESLQARIMDYDAAQGVSFVGSEADYKRWALEVDGTGNAVIIPASDETGLITIVLTDSNGDPANETLRKEVYNHILRPDSPSERLAPINGGNIAVVAPETVALTINVLLEISGLISLDVIKESILSRMKNYLIEASEDEEIRYTRVGSIIASTEGVEDYKNLLVNNDTANIAINNQQLPTIDAEGLNITVGIV